jgi:hypothetical protein
MARSDQVAARMDLLCNAENSRPWTAFRKIYLDFLSPRRVADIAILSEAADDIFIESSKMFIEQFWI